MNVLLSNFPIH